jgi:hypothetical protein
LHLFRQELWVDFHILLSQVHLQVGWSNAQMIVINKQLHNSMLIVVTVLQLFGN